MVTSILEHFKDTIAEHRKSPKMKVGAANLEIKKSKLAKRSNEVHKSSTALQSSYKTSKKILGYKGDKPSIKDTVNIQLETNVRFGGGGDCKEWNN